MKKINLYNLGLSELEAFIAHLGKERYRARQIMKWLYQKGAVSFMEMTDLSQEFRKEMAEIAYLEGITLVKVKTSQDGTKKYLFRLSDGLSVESVLIPGRNHHTACLSTQVGCRMGCVFCLTGKGGLKRNLLPGEIVGQLLYLKLRQPEGREVKNVVFMGMGEPLDNYENTLKAVEIITSPYGFNFSQRKVTLSTCGLVPMIERLGRDISINLAISLNAADNRTRSFLMPINNTYPLEDLLSTCRKYPMPGRRMLTFEYILVAGINDSVADAQNLVKLLQGIRCKLNLIAFNSIPGCPFKPPKEADIRAFQQVLIKHHLTAIVRASKGSDIMAACGQLSAQNEEENLC